MRITLLHPATESHLQTHRSGNGHLGLGYIASYLLQRGHRVRVLDAKNDVVNDGVLRRHLFAFKPELFGVTAMTHEVHAAAFRDLHDLFGESQRARVHDVRYTQRLQKRSLFRRSGRCKNLGARPLSQRYRRQSDAACRRVNKHPITSLNLCQMIQ